MYKFKVNSFLDTKKYSLVVKKVKRASYKYKLWKKHINYKRLKLRTKKRKRLKNKKKINHINNSLLINKRLEDLPEDIETLNFTCPEYLSIFINDQITLKYFQDVINAIKSNKNKNRKKFIYIDTTNVIYISIEAIMYLIAITRVKDCYNRNLSFGGSFPNHSESKRIFQESGFLNFVEANKMDSITRSEHFQIITGCESDPILASKICDYINEKLYLQKKDTKFLYKIIIELMTNTKNHAYQDNDLPMINNWYIFIENDKDILKLTFIDTGEGLPKTITKKFIENINIFIKDSKYIYSALKGEDLRTETKLPYRGKGLPKIYKIVEQGLIQNFKVISGKGWFERRGAGYNLKDSKTSFMGTLFYWEMNKSLYRKRVE